MSFERAQEALDTARKAWDEQDAPAAAAALKDVVTAVAALQGTLAFDDEPFGWLRPTTAVDAPAVPAHGHPTVFVPGLTQARPPEPDPLAMLPTDLPRLVEPGPLPDPALCEIEECPRSLLPGGDCLLDLAALVPVLPPMPFPADLMPGPSYPPAEPVDDDQTLPIPSFPYTGGTQ